MDVKTFLALVLRHGLTTAAGMLVTHGYLASSGTEQFVSAGLFLAAIAWSWWQKSGQAQVAALLKKLTGHQTMPGAVAEAKLIPAAPVVSPQQEAQTIATAAKIGAALLLGLLLFAPHRAFAQQKPVSPLVAPLSQLLGKLIDDAQAASDDAKAHSDVIAQTCYDAIVVVANQQLTAMGVQSGTIGPILVLQKARDIGRLSSTPQGTALVVGCAPLVQDAKLNMVQFFGNIGATALIKGLLIP